MSHVYIGGRQVRLQANQLIGSGGEADVYALSSDTVLKLYRKPTDPLYATPDQRTGAAERIREQQRKLPSFPPRLPSRIIAPRDLAYDNQPSGHIIGYTMEYLRDMEVLLRLGNRAYREAAGIDGNRVIDTFRDLYALVQQVHARGVVIGDFNDLNVLLDASGRVHMVDADSMQFGSFLCHTFTERFVDPLICGRTRLAPIQPHTEMSDWYAYLIMLCQSLLFVGPYGGVHVPKTGKRLQLEQRVLQRITFFDEHVRYPKTVLPLKTLPDDLLDYFTKVFTQDVRSVPPVDMLSNIRWSTCRSCGSMHARPTCPACATPGVITQTVTIRGKVTARRLFRTRGRILYCESIPRTAGLEYLYHENGQFRREDGGVVLEGNLDPTLRYRIRGHQTLLGKRNQLLILESSGSGKHVTRQNTDTYRNISMFDTNTARHFWLENGQLMRSGTYTPERIGSVLSGQTMFWVGEQLGFGLYQAGQLQRFFTFNPEGQGINDQVDVPAVSGQLLDAVCVFSEDLAWFMVSVQSQGRLVNRCSVINRRGSVLAHTEVSQDSNSWLAAGIRGHFATALSLYTATDTGIVRIGINNGQFVEERRFPDTEPFVDSASKLLPTVSGVYVVSSRDITLLEIR